MKISVNKKSEKKGRSRKSRSTKLGLPPGTAVYIGEKRIEPIRISVIFYNQTSFTEEILNTPEECASYLQRAGTDGAVAWINVDGLHDVAVIEKLAQQIGLHPLVIEDIVNTTQRPKCLDYTNYLHTVLKMINIDPAQKRIETEQLSLILGPHYVVSFQEQRGDCFDSLRERIRTGKGRSRSCDADYLFYAIIDSIVDHYFVVVEELDDKIERLEEELLLSATTFHLTEIHRSRRELLDIRRAVWPLRELIQSLIRDEGKLISDATRLFIRDVYDHSIEVIEVVELLRDTSGGLIELYLSHSSNKVNMVMKTLTVIATIFMPLTFIVGVYGMNFDVMPELHWHYGYPLVMFFMLLLSTLMLAHFKRKGWL